MRFKDWETAEPIAPPPQPSASTASQRLMTTVMNSSGIVIAPKIQLLKRPAIVSVLLPQKEVVAIKGVSFESRQKAYETAKARIDSESDQKKDEAQDDSAALL